MEGTNTLIRYIKTRYFNRQFSFIRSFTFIRTKVNTTFSFLHSIFFVQFGLSCHIADNFHGYIWCHPEIEVYPRPHCSNASFWKKKKKITKLWVSFLIGFISKTFISLLYHSSLGISKLQFLLMQPNL